MYTHVYVYICIGYYSKETNKKSKTFDGLTSIAIVLLFVFFGLLIMLIFQEKKEWKKIASQYQINNHSTQWVDRYLSSLGYILSYFSIPTCMVTFIRSAFGIDIQRGMNKSMEKVSIHSNNSNISSQSRKHSRKDDIDKEYIEATEDFDIGAFFTELQTVIATLWIEFNNTIVISTGTRPPENVSTTSISTCHEIIEDTYTDNQSSDSSNDLHPTDMDVLQSSKDDNKITMGSTKVHLNTIKTIESMPHIKKKKGSVKSGKSKSISPPSSTNGVSNGVCATEQNRLNSENSSNNDSDSSSKTGDKHETAIISFEKDSQSKLNGNNGNDDDMGYIPFGKKGTTAVSKVSSDGISNENIHKKVANESPVSPRYSNLDNVNYAQQKAALQYYEGLQKQKNKVLILSRLHVWGSPERPIKEKENESPKSITTIPPHTAPTYASVTSISSPNKKPSFPVPPPKKNLQSKTINTKIESLPFPLIGEPKSQYFPINSKKTSTNPIKEEQYQQQELLDDLRCLSIRPEETAAAVIPQFGKNLEDLMVQNQAFPSYDPLKTTDFANLPEFRGLNTHLGGYYDDDNIDYTDEINRGGSTGVEGLYSPSILPDNTDIEDMDIGIK